ncbi:MAG TPA: Gp138 family membrane-puncturing spike protein [bacterium]|nr:Gp138 family membrane-puncturing spike protein [bacterium]
MGAENFFDDEEGPEQGVTPTFAEVIKTAISSQMADLRVSMPAKVLKYDHKKQLAEVQPLFRRRYPDGKVLDPPKVYNVPVGHPRAGDTFIHLPIKPGDLVNLVIMDRSTDKWLDSGDMIEPDDVRTHDLSDAWAYPGVWSKNKAFSPANGDDLILKNGKGEVRVREDGKFQVLGQGDLVAAVHELAVATHNLGQACVSSGEVPGAAPPTAAIAAARDKIGKFKA